MRAYNTAAPGAVGYVDWIVNDQPDSNAIYCPDGYSSINLENIIVNRIVQSKIDNFLKPLNSSDGYFFHLNSYDWIHPPTSPYATTQDVPPQITGLAAVRGYTTGLIPRDHSCMFWDETLSGWKFAYNTGGDGYTIGASLPIFTGTLSIDGYLALGTYPAQSGIIRIPNVATEDAVVRGRNATNTGDVDILQVDIFDRVQLGSNTTSVYIANDLLVEDSISHGLTGASTTGFIRLQNTEGIHVRNDLDSGNLNLIETLGDLILIGDLSNEGITHNVGDGYIHSFEVNDIPQLEVGLSFVRFHEDVNNPSIFQTTQATGNGQTLTILAQTSSFGGSTGGALILGSGSGTTADGYVQIKNGINPKIHILDTSTLFYTSNLTFDKDTVTPVISQVLQTSGSGQLLTINAQDANGIGADGGSFNIAAGDSVNIGNGGALSIYAGNASVGYGGVLSIIAGSSLSSGYGGNLYLSSGAGIPSNQSGAIVFQYGLVSYGNFNVDINGAYFDIGLAPAQSGVLRVPNNLTALSARNAANSNDIHLIGTDGYDNIVFDNNNQAEHIYFDGLQKLYVNLMGAEPYLKAENGAYIDLPGGSVTSANNFAIDGSHVDGYVTAAMLNALSDNYLDGYWHTAQGGTGLTSYNVGDILYASNTNILAALPASDDGYVLALASGVPAWIPNVASGSNFPIEMDLLKGLATDSTGIATAIGACYVDTSQWPTTRTVKFRCILESTNATATYAATADLYDISGTAQVSGSQIDNTGASSQLIPSMIETDITAAFAGTVVGVFEVRLWIANSGGGNIVTCKSAQIIIEG